MTFKTYIRCRSHVAAKLDTGSVMQYIERAWKFQIPPNKSGSQN